MDLDEDYSPPRTAPWPPSVLETIRARMVRAHAFMVSRPHLPPYEVGD